MALRRVALHREVVRVLSYGIYPVRRQKNGRKDAGAGWSGREGFPASSGIYAQEILGRCAG